MKRLPEEIINIILWFSKTRVHLAFGRSPDARQMFVEGGPSFVLESILKHDADIKSLFKLKQYVPSSIALCKAVLTENIVYIKRICLVWNTCESNDAFALACRHQFLWGIENIRPRNAMTVKQKNRVYFEVGQLDKIDLCEERPFHDLLNTDNRIKAKRLDYLPFKNSLSTAELLPLYVINGDEEKVYDIMEKDLSRVINFRELIFGAFGAGVYKLPWDLFQKYGPAYFVPVEEVMLRAVRIRNLDALAYLQVPYLHVHQAILYQDVDQLNDCLKKNRGPTLDVMSMYDIDTTDVYSEVLYTSEIRLDQDGFWVGLMERQQRKFSFGIYDTIDDGSINLTIEMIKKQEIDDINYFSRAYGRYAPSPRILLFFINMYGREAFNNIKDTLYIVPYLSYIDIESTCQLLSILLEWKYPIKEMIFRSRPYMHPRLEVCISGKTIYYTTYPVDSHKCHLEDDLYTNSEFSSILFAKDIAVAFQTYSSK